MKEYQTTKGQTYIVTSKNECQVKGYLENNTEYLLLTVPANSQAVFVAISNKTKLTDANAVIIPFEEASIALGGAGGGISEEELIEKGVIEEWNQVTYNKVSQMGSTSGFGSTQPTFKTCTSFEIGCSSNLSFNCIKFYCVFHNEPIVKINGQSGIYVNHEVVGSYFLITYRFNTPITFYPSMDFQITRCTVGGGDNNNSMFSVYGGLDDGFYPYFGFYNYKEETLKGIENNVYKVVSVDGSGHINALSTNADVVGMLNYLGNLLDAEYVWGSLSPSDSTPSILGFTFTTNKTNEQERMRDYNEIQQEYQYISGGSHLELIKLR